MRKTLNNKAEIYKADIKPKKGMVRVNSESIKAWRAIDQGDTAADINCKNWHLSSGTQSSAWELQQ